MMRRPRRNRDSESIRRLVSETKLSMDDFIAPLFICSGKNEQQKIENFPEVYRLSIDLAAKKAKQLHQLGVRAVLLFGHTTPDLKDEKASEASNPKGLVPLAIQAIKDAVPELCVMTDIALDPFISHGHDGVVDESGYVLNDETCEILGKMALTHTEAGCDFVAPSDMMDGRVAYLREMLDGSGFQRVGIMSYTAKYASALYGPFRNCLESAPRFGDKKTYQMNPANSEEALIEAALDIEEGADILMVKPATFYLDVIHKLKSSCSLPIAAYHVSGEYSMLYAAHKAGFMDLDRGLLESTLSIKRAGADIIITYAAERLARLI